MRKSAVFCLVSLFLFCFLGSAHAVTLEEIKERGYIRVGLHPELPPFTYYDEDQNLIGWDIDIVTRIADMWGVEVKYYPKVWVELIPSLLVREYDIIVAPMTITVARAKLIAFTLPHFNAGQSVIVRAREENIKDHTDLQGKKVVVIKGTTCEQAAISVGAKVLPKPAQDDCNEALLSGEADAHVIDRPIAMSAVKQYKGRLKIVGKPFTIEYYGYAVHKADTELQMQLNQAMTILKEKGIVDAIISKWF